MATGLADKPGVFETLPDHTNDTKQEAPRVGVLAFVESERLLVAVSEQVKRFHADIRATDSALEQRPEVFQPVGMHVVPDVAYSMVDLLMGELLIKAVVGAERIRIDCGAGFLVLKHYRAQIGPSGCGYGLHFDSPLAFKQSHDNGLAPTPALMGPC